MTLTPEQLELRKNGIGASEIAAVAGVSPWESPIDVYLRKIGEAVVEQNETMELGNDLEPIICRRALRKLGLKDAIYGDTRAHPRVPCILATPDFILPELVRTGMQCKNVTYRTIHHWGDEDDDRAVPLHYVAQVQQEMEVWDLDRIFLAAMMAGREVKVFEVQRDREVGAALVETGERFWRDHVIPRRPPAVDGSWGAERWIRDRYSRVKEVTVEATGEMLEAAEDLHEAKRAQKEADFRARLAEQRLKVMMGEAAVLVVGDDKITWRPESRVSWKQVAEAAGATEDLIAQHRSATRVMRLPRAWGHE